MAKVAHMLLGRADESGDLRVAESVLLPAMEARGGGIVAGGADLPFHLHDLAHLAQKPRVDRGELVDLVDVHSRAQRVADGEDALRTRRAEEIDHSIAFVAARL